MLYSFDVSVSSLSIFCFLFCPCNQPVSFSTFPLFLLHSAMWQEMKQYPRGVSCSFSFLFPLETFFLNGFLFLNETSEGDQSIVSGYKKGPYGCSRVWDPLYRQRGSYGSCDGVIERKDKTRCKRSQAEEFCWVMFDGVCCCTHLHLTLFFLFSSLSQVLSINGEADKEKTEAKRKIAKLEDALRYSEKVAAHSVICCMNLRHTVKLSMPNLKVYI